MNRDKMPGSSVPYGLQSLIIDQNASPPENNKLFSAGERRTDVPPKYIAHGCDSKIHRFLAPAFLWRWNLSQSLLCVMQTTIVLSRLSPGIFLFESPLSRHFFDEIISLPARRRRLTLFTIIHYLVYSPFAAIVLFDVQIFHSKLF